MIKEEVDWGNLNDEEFLDEFFNHELSPTALEELDIRLLSSDFASKYEHHKRMRFTVSTREAISNYLPMIGLIILIIIGFYLACIKLH